jgi:hypothetical protein
MEEAGASDKRRRRHFGERGMVFGIAGTKAASFIK